MSKPTIGKRIDEALERIADKADKVNDPFGIIVRRALRLKGCRSRQQRLWPAWAWCGVPGLAVGAVSSFWTVIYVFGKSNQTVAG